MAELWGQAQKASNGLKWDFEAKYSKAVGILEKERGSLMAFCDAIVGTQVWNSVGPNGVLLYAIFWLWLRIRSQIELFNISTGKPLDIGWALIFGGTLCSIAFAPVLVAWGGVGVGVAAVVGFGLLLPYRSGSVP